MTIEAMSWFSCFLKGKNRLSVDSDEEISQIENVKMFTYRELRHATKDFCLASKIGEGGFGPVYKGTLKDGTVVAIKALSKESNQGKIEFLTEINVISNIIHDNLAGLYGCCVEKDHRILVYSYIENNSLAQTLLGANHSGIQFSWKVRSKICIGIAQGLAFLHEEVQPHIVHRDIKAGNILLDENLNPKISDFGLAKLLPPAVTHVSTRVAGTIGYLDPEYAIRGQVTRQSDVYGFGVLLLEIVSGRSNTDTRLSYEEQILLEWTWVLYEQGKLSRIVDTEISEESEIEKACRFLKVGLLCTQYGPKLRPSMSKAVKMLKGEIDVDSMKINHPSLISDIMDFRSRINDNSNDTKNTASISSSLETSGAAMSSAATSDRE